MFEPEFTGKKLFDTIENMEKLFEWQMGYELVKEYDPFNDSTASKSVEETREMLSKPFKIVRECYATKTGNAFRCYHYSNSLLKGEEGAVPIVYYHGYFPFNVRLSNLEVFGYGDRWLRENSQKETFPSANIAFKEMVCIPDTQLVRMSSEEFLKIVEKTLCRNDKN